VTLFGHIADARDGKVMFKSDLKETLAKMDKAEKDILAMVDKYIEVIPCFEGIASSVNRPCNNIIGN